MFIVHISLVKSKVQLILDTKSLRSPKEFCMDIPPTGQLSNSSGEGSSRQNFVPLDNDGLFIDLNESYEDENEDEHHNEDLG